jgi:hypothetical protein
MDAYIRWLKESDQPLFEIGGTYWRPYQKGLVPASLKPEPIKLDSEQARKLLQESRALFLRYFSAICKTPTPFWYTACSDYNFENLARKTRTQVQRGNKECRIERIDPLWLAEYGYDCYLAAFAKYRNARPESEAKFSEECRLAANGPFDFWGVFVAGRLAAYVKYCVGSDYAAGLEMKLDPRYLSFYPSAALQNTILSTYVAGQRKTVFAGFRSVLHDTNIHDFLLRFGYRRVHCDFKLVYRPAVGALVNLLYAVRTIADRLPGSAWSNRIQSVVRQEGLRRLFALDARARAPRFGTLF